METNIILTNFLKELTLEIENKTISETDLQKIGEFYMSFLYEKKQNNNLDITDFYKFLIMGWYIYSIK
jgi:hypothetical protein